MESATKAELEALKNDVRTEIQALKTESCPLELFVKFRENVQTDHASFTSTNDQKLNSMHDEINNSMKRIIQECQAEFERTQKTVTGQISDIMQQLNAIQIQQQIAQGSQQGPGPQPTQVEALVQQIAGINKIQQSSHEKMEIMSLNITELQKHVGSFIATFTSYDQQIEEIKNEALKGKGKGRPEYKLPKEKTLLDPKFLQVRHLTDKICTSRGLFVKWRRNLNKYVDSFSQARERSPTSSRA